MMKCDHAHFHSGTPRPLEEGDSLGNSLGRYLCEEDFSIERKAAGDCWRWNIPDSYFLLCE